MPLAMVLFDQKIKFFGSRAFVGSFVKERHADWIIAAGRRAVLIDCAALLGNKRTTAIFVQIQFYSRHIGLFKKDRFGETQ